MIEKDQLKKKLQSYQALRAEHQQITEELERVEAVMAAPRGPNMDGMPRSPGAGDPVLGVVSQHIALQERYTAQLERLAAAQADIEDLIESLDPKARKLLRHRYIEGLSWEEVCVAMSYSWRQVHNIHSQALTALLEKTTEN